MVLSSPEFAHLLLKKPGYFQLVADGEPFRLLFPLGLIIGVIGVSLWPAYILHWSAVYPGLMHPRIMIEGFLTCFVVGFLGTALPRLLDVPRLTWPETWGFAIGLSSLVYLHLTGQTFHGDLVFAIAVLLLVLLLAARARHRKDTPPPAFLLVAAGILCALTGAVIQLVIGAAPAALPDAAFPLGRLLLYQGYMLLPVMGIGAFLLPRFFDLPNRQSFPESLSLPPGWLRRAAFAAFCGGIVLASFILEALGQLRWGYALRAGAVILYFWVEVPVHRSAFSQGTLAMSLRLALVSIPAGFLLMAVWPQRAASFIHIVMITGFSLLTFTVATRVVLGHSGQSGKFKLTLRPVLIMTACVATAMLTRVGADWLPAARMTHLAYASAVWAIGAIIWGLTILPSVRLASPDADG